MDANNLAAPRALARQCERDIARVTNELERARYLKSRGNHLFPVQLVLLDSMILYNERLLGRLTQELDTLTKEIDTMNPREEAVNKTKQYIVSHKADLVAFYNKLRENTDLPSVTMSVYLDEQIKKMDAFLIMCDKPERPWPGCCGQCLDREECEMREKEHDVNDEEYRAYLDEMGTCETCGGAMKCRMEASPNDSMGDGDCEVFYCPNCEIPF